MQKLLAHLEVRGAREGFLEYFAECTGIISQKIFTKLDYLTQREI
jgi:hypothetical protein